MFRIKHFLNDQIRLEWYILFDEKPVESPNKSYYFGG